MPSPLHIRCHVCGQPVGITHHSFDRRVETLGSTRRDGELVPTCNVVFDEALYVYCSDACWDVHQAEIASALALTQTYPVRALATPCSRCGIPVDRTEPHVAYRVTTTHVAEAGALLGCAVDGRDFAVLCRACEAPEPVVDSDLACTLDG